MAHSGIIGERVAQFRTELKMTGAQLAKKSGVQRTVIVNIENGRKQQVTVEELLKLAYALEVSPLSLLVDTKDPFGPLLGMDSFGVRNAEAIKWVVDNYRQGPETLALSAAARVLAFIPSKAQLVQEAEVDIATRGVNRAKELTVRRLEVIRDTVAPGLRELEDSGVPIPDELFPSPASILEEAQASTHADG